MRYIGQIILTQDIIDEIQTFQHTIAPSDLRIFNLQTNEKMQDSQIISELKIDVAHSIIAESYIASSEKKIILIPAYTFGKEAQNALLKILEEPPENVQFIIITQNKTSLLPTIRSRMLIEDKRKKTDIADFALDLSTLNLDKLTVFIDTLAKNIKDSKLEGRALVESLLFATQKLSLKFSQDELGMFDNAFIELANNRRAHFVLLPLLLMINQKLKGLQ